MQGLMAMRWNGSGKCGPIWLGRAFKMAAALCVLGVCPARADGVCADPDPVYLDSDAQGSLCEASFVPQTSGGSDAAFVMTARSGVDRNAPTDPDASGSLGTVRTRGTGAGVKTASCGGSNGISGGGGNRDEELIFTYSDGLAVDCVIVGLADIELYCDDDRPSLTADAGQDQTAFGVDLITLDSAGSVAPEGVALSYAWTQVAGPVVALSDSNAPQPTFAAPVAMGPTRLEFQLELSDGVASSTASTVVTVNVQDPTNTPPVADAGLDQSIEALSAVLLDASATLDPDGNPLTFRWEQVAGPEVILIDANTAQARFLAPQVQGLTDLVFRVAVTDGQADATSTVSAAVDCTNDEPVIFIRSAGSSVYDYTVSTAQIAAVFNPTTDKHGTVAFDDFTFLPAGLVIEAFKIRETARHIYVEFISCDCPCSTDSECSDGDACNGAETCDPTEGCIPGTPLTCDDGDPCNGTETCDPSSGCVSGTALPTGTSCDDGDVCNGVATCDAGSQCQAGTPLACDDGNECNGVETCDPVAGCQPGTPLLCPPLDVVFALDTSGSMQNEGETLCTIINDVVADLSSQGVLVNDHILAIHPNYTSNLFSCQSPSDTVSALLGDAVPGDPDGCPGDLSGDSNSEKDENWGPATAIVADRYPWTPGATRVIVPVSDEGACLGNGCNDPGSDRDAVDNAVAVAVANNVIVSPITGDGSSACVITLAQIMATGTGGTAFNSTEPASDLADAIAALILAACEPTDVCDDDNLCTTGDACVADQCVGTPVGCGHLDDQCNVGVCSPTTGQCEAVPTPGLACSDGSACTEGDTCDAGGVCQGTPVTCDDGNVCTDDACNLTTGCIFTPDDSNACDDGDACTTDACVASACIGTAVDCSGLNDTCNIGVCNPTTGNCEGQFANEGGACANDGNECTSDVCESGVCIHPSLADDTPCSDDGIGCTVDQCKAGSCAHVPNHAVCNDSEDCTDDTCDPVNGDPLTGCLYTSDDTNTCADSDNCTDDACVAGACVGTAVDCSHLNGACNVGVCNPISGACQAQAANEGGACAGDGNECTSDVCAAGVCTHPAVATGVACTGDGIGCTVDECITGACVHTPNDGVCNDSESCTDDTCNPVSGDPLTGCLFTPNDANACSDGDNCTTDACVTGACENTPVDCSGLNDDCNLGVCNPGTGSCEAQPINEGQACTGDGNECTTDICQAGACVHPAVADGALCTDDGNDCTDDVCVAAACTHPDLTVGTSCANDGIACTVDQCDAGVCIHTPSNAICNDNSVCTTDTCFPVTGCSYADVAGCCTDDAECNDEADACTSKACNTTDGTCFLVSEVDCTHLDDACNVGVCIPATGACEASPINEGGACVNDGNECTNDACQSGVCTHTALADGTTCTADALSCTVDECVGGACAHTPNHGVCDDNESCTDDTCDPANGDLVTGCLSTPDDSNACTDGDNCTNDACVAGACTSTAVNCSHVDDACNVGVCNPITGACEAQPDNEGGPCPGDGNDCTDDLCQLGVCTHSALVDGTPCADEGVGCTVDECLAGACSHDPDDSACDDAESCTDDTCDTATGCVFTPDGTNTCTDDDNCTNDACVAGACAITAVNCSHLSDACNVGVCNPDTGACEAQPTNEGGLCPEDGSECTSDVCQGGACIHPALAEGTICTDEGIGCTVDECIAGTCSHTPDDNACDDAESCTNDICDSVNGNPVTGCLFTAEDTNTCTDGNNCTNDACVAGTCVGTAVDCGHLDDACNVGVCDQTTGACEADATNHGGLCLDDGNSCTNDLCEAGLCTHPAVVDGVACPDDGVGCTVDECIAGQCMHQPDDLACEDQNPCTDDWCDPGLGCQFTPDDNLSCESDGDFCTIDTCVNGTCETSMVTCPPDDECAAYTCNPDTGLCVPHPINDGWPCTADQNDCTDDICMFAKCQHPALDDGTPCADDMDDCTDDLCSNGSCSHPELEDGTPCAEDAFTCSLDVCVEGTCDHLPLDGACDDEQGCTDDTCDLVDGDLGTGCLFTPNDGNTCTDDIPCTDDACVNGTCGSEPVDCTHLDDDCNVGVCDEQTGECRVEPANEGEACPDDGATCTSDLCVAGQCTHQPDDSSCDDANPCTDDTCEPANGDQATGCLFTPDNTNACADSDNCTNDACVAGACMYTPVDCSPLDDDCNEGACDSATGDCFKQPAFEGASCEADGNVCTLDHCDGAGMCVFDSDVVCPDNNDACTDLACDPARGADNCDDIVIVNEGGPCEDDGDECTLNTCAAGTCAYSDSGSCRACCMPNDICVRMPRAACQASGGYVGTQSACIGNSTGEGKDDACVILPSVSEWGMAWLVLLLLAGFVAKFGLGSAGQSTDP